MALFMLMVLRHSFDPGSSTCPIAHGFVFWSVWAEQDVQRHVMLVKERRLSRLLRTLEFYGSTQNLVTWNSSALGAVSVKIQLICLLFHDNSQ